MRTVKEVSSLTGVSIRALHYYDTIGLLAPTQVTESGYRLYDDKAMERLQMILLFRELKFPLKEIGQILESPFFDRKKALKQQIRLLEMQRERIQDLIDLAREIETTGVENMLDFKAFDRKKIDEYAKAAREEWGNTVAYQEYEEKSVGQSEDEKMMLGKDMMEIFGEFGKLRKEAPDSQNVQELVQKLRDFITEHYYTCTPEILGFLGEMYVGDTRFTANIDNAGGDGTAVFAGKAIKSYCGKLDGK